MTGILDQAAREALARVSDPDVRVLCGRFYRYLAEEDLPGHPIDTVERHAEALIDLAGQREPGTARVRVTAPDDTDDISAVLEIITDDMPFLVDSVTNALAVAGRGVHLVVHPQLVVRRDEQGMLVEILDIDVDDD